MTATTWALPRPRTLLDGPPTDLVCTLSLFLLVLNTNADRVLFLPAVVALVVGLLRPRWSRHPAWWLVAGSVMGARQLAGWEGIDDHVVVTSYWCLALGLGLTAAQPAPAVARSARLLIGLVFGFAAYWKLASPDFLSGDFFRYTLLVDERFRSVAEALGGVPTNVYDANTAQLQSLYDSIPTDGHVTLTGGQRLELLVVAMTAWGVLTELAISLAHLLPLPRRLAALRPATLLLFCVGTYLVVPVGGFGCLLVTMALADDQLTPRWRSGLLWLFAGLVVYGPLWWAAFG